MQTINLDLSTKSVIPLLNVKQMEVGRKFKAAITEDGKPYSLAGVVFSVWYSGTSGEGNYTNIGDTSAFSVSGNNVTVELITQMVDNAGKGALCLVMNTANGDQIATWNIPYYVEAVPGAGSQEATNYYNAFQKVLEDLPYPDTTLSIPGKSADAAVVGKAFERLETITPISEDADVDSLVTPGRYACETEEVAKTLLGCQVEEPFTLDVRYANGKGPRVSQDLRPEGKGARLYRQFVGCEEVLSEEAKVLYNRVHGLKPQGNGFNGVHDYSWYAENLSTKTAILESASQLYGLADIVNGTNGATQDTLEGWTIKLGNDIVVNKGDASEWDGNASGVYTWTRIGVNPTDSGSTRNFRGTFDGQGHYISGLYSGARNNNGLFGFTYGATIKNLAVINSYFATNASDGQFLGSVVARLLSGGTLKNVYSDAILVSRQGDWFTGGVAGCVKYSKADSCVFAGTIFSDELTGKNNKYIGGITGGSDSGGHSAELTNCLFIGAIESNDSGVGGIAGMLGPGSVVDGCVSAGTIEGDARQVGAVLGWVSGTGNHAITNCYYSAELGRNLYAGGDAGSVAETTGSKKLPAECMKYSMIPGKWVQMFDSEHGYGYGDIPELVDCNEDPDGTIFESHLNQILETMKDGQTKQIRFCCFPHISGSTFVGTLWRHQSGYGTLHGVSYDGFSIQKRFFNGNWYPHEWVNPPMSFGFEYRTTERHGGNPVYTKLINCGQNTHGKEVSLEYPNVIRYAARATNGVVYPFAESTSDYHRRVQISQQEIMIIAGKAAENADTVYCQIWYTK